MKSVTARELLESNADFGPSSPLLVTARRFHTHCERLGIDYAIVGGLAVIRNGARRTTMDVDILIAEADWAVLARGESGLTVDADQAVDTETGISVDALFPGDEWEMMIPLPEPAEIAEYDAELGARFAGLGATLAIKTAVYAKKRAEDGEAIAAKDLADIVSLVQCNGSEVVGSLAAEMEPAVRETLLAIVDQVDGPT